MLRRILMCLVMLSTFLALGVSATSHASAHSLRSSHAQASAKPNQTCNKYVCDGDGDPIPAYCKVHQHAFPYSNGQIISSRVPGKLLAWLWPYYSPDCGGIYWVAFKNVSGVTLTSVAVHIGRSDGGSGAVGGVTLANNAHVDSLLLIAVPGAYYFGDGGCEDYYNAGIVTGNTLSFS